MIDVTNTLLTTYEDKFSEIATGNLAKEFLYLAKLLKKEEKITMDLVELQGAFEMLMAGASVADQNTDGIITSSAGADTQDAHDMSEILPSESARENVVINVN